MFIGFLNSYLQKAQFRMAMGHMGYKDLEEYGKMIYNLNHSRSLDN